ncbi:MAG: hypothetical protein GWP59_06350 [Chlamydiales bacterium]|nr:OmpH family outer membrane protein [Chlamydiales bacterium]NCF71304.1 hypothetical protein [Chlamydiales bacterium]
MFKKIASALTLGLTALSLCSFGFSGGLGKVGVIDLQACHEESALAKAEGQKLEDLKSKLRGGLEEKEKQFKMMKDKYDDQAFRDSLSDDAKMDYEKNMGNALKDLEQYHSQLVRSLNQSGYEVAMSVLSSVEAAAGKIAKSKELDMVIRKELCLFYSPDLDVTKEVIAEMDNDFSSVGNNEADKTAKPVADSTKKPAQAR